MYTNPDSVKRVNPPKITIPKTLAALPRSQYATDLSLILGKLDDLALVAPSSIALVNVGAAAVRLMLEVKNWRFLSVKREDRILIGWGEGIAANRRTDLAA